METTATEVGGEQGGSHAEGTAGDVDGTDYDAWGRIQREVVNADYNLVARLAAKGQAVLEPLISTAALQTR